MKSNRSLLGLVLAVSMGFVPLLHADDAGTGGKSKSLESRIAELEAKLKDAGVGGGVKGSGIKVSGYVDTSYLLNLSDRDNSGGAAPVAGSSAQNTGRVFDNQFDAFNLNAVKLTIEKDKDTSKFPAGFRVDTIVGEDAGVLNGTNARNDSTVFIEQAYINLGIPVGNGIDVKVGKMAALIGYEVIESPVNWQFSRSDAFRLAPFTHTGAHFAYKWNDTVTTTAGLVNGWDSSDANGLLGGLNRNTSLSFVGRVDVTGPKTSLGDFNAFVAGMYGNDVLAPALNPNLVGVANGSTLNGIPMYIFDIGGTWDKPFGLKPATLGIEALYRGQGVNTATVAANVNTVEASIDAGSLSAYGKWDWNKWLTTSGRFSYSMYDTASQQANGVIVAQQTLSPLVVPTNQGGAQGFFPAKMDLFSFTLTQAFNVWKDTLVRLEWRRDWTTGKAAGFGLAGAGGAVGNSDIRQDQDTIAVNVVYSF